MINKKLIITLWLLVPAPTHGFFWSKKPETQRIPIPGCCPQHSKDIVLNLYNNNNNSSTNANYCSHQTQSNFVANQQSFMSNLPSRLPKNLPELKKAIIDNPYIVAGSAISVVIGLYGFVFYKLISLSNKASSHESWHAYKGNITFEELLKVPQQSLGQELVASIQQRYASQAIESFFVPFILFVKEIDQEVAYLEQLVVLQKRLNQLHLDQLFPWDGLVGQEDAHQKLQRVFYLKNVVLTWISTFKIDTHTKSISQ